MPDSLQVPDFVAAALSHLPERPEVHNALDVLTALSADLSGHGPVRIVSGELLRTARAMLRCVVQHGDAEGHMEKFLAAPEGRTADDLLSAVQVWIDTVGPVWAQGSPPEGAIFSFAAYDNETGERISVDELSPHELLAARLITARLGRDNDQFRALAHNALHDDPSALVNGAVGVLDLCARTVQDGG
jgi:hypothetical protein